LLFCICIRIPVQRRGGAIQQGVWDGNEVWLVTGGGALFAAFPNVYATVFSGFYLALMLLLASLIFRAVAIEFRSKRPERWWRQLWDVSFAAGNVLAALLIRRIRRWCSSR
jgi:cytochrome d ubiquinol oxidase subunit II